MKTRPRKKICRAPSKKSRKKLRSVAYNRRRRRAALRAANGSSLAVKKPAPAADKKTPPPFASLDFPGRQMLYPHELAERIGCCIRHVYDLIFEGQLHAIDISGGNNSSDRRSIRIPLESWHKFVNDRLM